MGLPSTAGPADGSYRREGVAMPIASASVAAGIGGIYLGLLLVRR